MADDKRFAFIPLEYESRERALEGELILDRLNGDVWTKNGQGELISATADLEAKIQEILNNGTTVFSFMHAKNRRVYRFYFENNVVRLDAALGLGSYLKYFRIRGAEDNSFYYVNELTPVGNFGASVMPFVDNEMYFVEFFNQSGEMISQQLFTAKYAPSVMVDNDPEKILSHIIIELNKNFLYLGEDVNSVIARVIAVYEDNSQVDITGVSGLVIDHNIDNNTLGNYEFTASYFYDDQGNYLEATKAISVVEDIYAHIIDLIIIPKKIVHLNDGSRSIILTILAYFDDGTVKDVSEDCIISSNFDNRLFNQVQHLTIRFNAGHTNVVDKNYDLLIKDNGSASENVILFNDNLLRLQPSVPYPETTAFFRVRDPEDINFYFTTIYAEINYDTAYVDRVGLEEKVQTGKNVIVEFYNEHLTLLDSDVFTMEFKANFNE